VASVFGDNAVGDGGVAVVAPDGPTGAIFVRTSKRIAVCDSKAREYAVRIFTVAEVEAAVWVLFGTFTVDYAIVRAVFTANSNGLSPKIYIAVSFAPVRIISDPDSPAFPGIVDCLLNSGVLSWNTNVTYIVGCECITLAVVKKISCKSVARNSPFASSGSSKFGIKCAGNFPRTTQQAPLEVILIRSRGPACGW